MEYVLRTNALCKQYGRSKVLDELSMNVPKGSIYGFVGRNGAGKTTLIRLICGLQSPTAGGYTIYGVDCEDRQIAKARKRMGAVVETPSIYLDMTAEENLKQQCLVLGLPSFDEIPKILKFVGLENTGKKHARNFSLGMRQRLGIAVALIGDPDFLVLDEPVNGLDPQGIIEIRELILRLNQEKQVTILISSHILDELARIATHYGFLEKGRLVKEISAKELEAGFRKCLQVEVSDTKSLALTLDKMRIEYEIVSDTTANIYGEIGISQLVLALNEEHCELLSSHEQNESLETYFINIVGGEQNG